MALHISKLHYGKLVVGVDTPVELRNGQKSKELISIMLQLHRR